VLTSVVILSRHTGKRRQGAKCPAFAPSSVLCFQTVTNCPDCKPFVLIFIQHAGGVYPPGRGSLKYCSNSARLGIAEWHEQSSLQFLSSAVIWGLSTVNLFRINTSMNCRKWSDELLILKHLIGPERRFKSFVTNTYEKPGGGGPANFSAGTWNGSP